MQFSCGTRILRVVHGRDARATLKVHQYSINSYRRYQLPPDPPPPKSPPPPKPPKPPPLDPLPPPPNPPKPPPAQPLDPVPLPLFNSELTNSHVSQPLPPPPGPPRRRAMPKKIKTIAPTRIITTHVPKGLLFDSDERVASAFVPAGKMVSALKPFYAATVVMYALIVSAKPRPYSPALNAGTRCSRCIWPTSPSGRSPSR